MIDPRAEAVRVLRKAEELTNDAVDLKHIAEAYIRLGDAMIEEESDKDVPTVSPEEPTVKVKVYPSVGLTEKQIGEAAAKALYWVFQQK